MQVVRILEEYHPRIRQRSKITRHRIISIVSMDVFQREKDILAIRRRNLRIVPDIRIGSVPRFPGRVQYVLSDEFYINHGKID